MAARASLSANARPCCAGWCCMSFLSRKPARPDGRDGGSGPDDEYDDYDLYAADGYHGEDDSWSPGQYFSPEGIKGRWAGENPGGRAGGRGQRDAGRGIASPGPNGHNGGIDGSGRGPDRARGQAAGGAPRGGAAAPGGGFGRDDAPRGDGFAGYGADEYASGAYDLPDGADEDRERPSAPVRRKRRDREDRTDWTGILRLRRDRGEDIWPDDGVSDEDYWASVAADRPLTEPGSPGHERSADPRPAQGPRAGADNRFGAEPRGPEPRSAEQRGVTGRLGPPPGQGSGPPGGATPPGGPQPGTAASGNPARAASGPNSFRPGTGATPTVGVTVSRPPTGTGSIRPAAAGGPGTGANPAWPGKPQATGRASGGFPAAAPRPSFQPNNFAAPAPAASRPPQDRGDWGERTERIERVNLSGYPEPRPAGRGQGEGQPTGHHPAAGPGSAPSRPAAPPVPAGPAAGAGAHARGRGDAGPADTGFRPAPDRREAARGPASRDSGHEAGGSIWSVPPRDTGPARGTDDDPLTSTAYSRSALNETDGRSYRVAARRSQAQTQLTDQTEGFVSGEYQQSQRRGGLTDDYPTASFQPVGQRAGQHRQSSDDQYRGDQYRGEQYRDGGGASAAQQATVRYPAYGSQQGNPAQPDRSQQAAPGQPALGEPTASQPALGQSGFGSGYGPGSAAQPGRGGNGTSYPGSGAAGGGRAANSLPVNDRAGGQYESRPPQHRQPGQPQPSASPLSAPVASPGQPGGAPSGPRSAAPPGHNPYDSGASGSYPYAGGQSYPDRSAPAPSAPPGQDDTDDRYYRTDQAQQDQAQQNQGRPGYPPGYGAGQGRRERPY